MNPFDSPINFVALRAPRLPTSLAAGLLLWLCVPGWASDLAMPETGEMEFSIIRKGDVIGNYRSRFIRKPDGEIDVATKISAELTLGPVRLYHFDHTSQEAWRNGKLVGLTADSDDDGEVHHLRLKEEGAALALDVDGKPTAIPSDSVPSSLWNMAMLGDRPVFDIVDGQSLKVAVACVPVPARTPEAAGTQCELTGDITRTLRYTPQSLLDGVTFLADDGSKILYRRR